MEKQETLIRIVAGDRFTPFGLAKKLGAKVLLESSSFVKGKERYSIMMVNQAFMVEQRNGQLWYQDKDRRARIKSRARDILDILPHFADQHSPVAQDFPFPAGGLGFLSWEFSRYCDKIRMQAKPDPEGLPEAAFLFGHVFVVFDHYTDLVYLIGLNYAEHKVDLKAELDAVESQIRDLNFSWMQEEPAAFEATVLEGHDDAEAYQKGVRDVQREIVAGNLLQCVLSRRMVVQTAMPALEAYRRLRSSNPSPYLFYIDFGGYQLFGSSPEVHVSVKQGVARIRPIAGTRRRGKDRDEDQALEKELLADPKERAEHLMLVDLARNDLGRFCNAGSVKVHSFMEIERYSHVMHIVSEVRGQLAEGVSPGEVIRSTFPAGTVSGAPKIRAIETLDRLEERARGFYAGLVGYFEPGGTMDTCITIRSALKKGDRLVLQAGAGLVYDSVPEREYRETQEKLMALAHAAGVEV